MVSKQTHTQTQLALDSLQKTVKEEISKKAKLGQDAIIFRNGKTCRVKANELI